MGNLTGTAAQKLAPLYPMPFNTSGAYFTGLSPETTLQLNFKLIVEVAPGPNDQLATLATSSPEFDPPALELYSRVCSRLPPGVPQDENPAGEFFKSVLGTLGDIVALGGALHPAFSLVGGGMKAVSKVIPTVQAVPRPIK